MKPRLSAVFAPGLALVVALGASASLAAPALVVAPPADAPALRAALLEGGVAVLPEDETARVLASAANSGVVCASDDVACWQAVGTLAGHEDVVILTATEVVTSAREGVRRALRLVPGHAGIRGAVLRQLGRVGAVVVHVQPPTATITLNGAPLSGGVADGLPPGPVAIAAEAEGFASHADGAVVVAGEVTRVDWSLQRPVADEPSLSPVLLWGGLSTVGAGVVIGTAIAAINFQANCRFDDTSSAGMSCRRDASSSPTDPQHDDVKVVDYVAIAVGAGLSAIGAGAAIASTFVE